MVGKNFSGKQMSEAFINSAFLALSEVFRTLIHIIREMKFFLTRRQEM